MAAQTVAIGQDRRERAPEAIADVLITLHWWSGRRRGRSRWWGLEEQSFACGHGHLQRILASNRLPGSPSADRFS